MDLRKALLLTLATTPLGGCYLHCNRIPQERYYVETVIAVAELDALLAEAPDPASAEQWACETICTSAYEARSGWRVSTLGVCDIERSGADEGEAAASFASVSCRGFGVEYFCKGRRPLGHVEHARHQGGDRLGATLAEMAELEAASILAFEQLAAQLRRLDAPVELIERCHAAADDERNHARWLGTLAERRGARVRSAQLDAHADDPLAIALHNATEGCVHEAFAALVAAVLGLASPSPILRRVYQRIAVDEAAHGQLAWDLDHWLHERLSTAERERVDAARRDALARLPERVGWLAALPAELGSFSPADAQQLARDFVRHVA